MFSHKKHKKEKRAYRPAAWNPFRAFSWQNLLRTVKALNFASERFSRTDGLTGVGLWGSRFATAFRRFAKGVREADGCQLLVSGCLELKRSLLNNHQPSTGNSNSPREFVPTDPTVKGLKSKILEGLRA